MLLVFHNGQHIDNTGQTASLKNAIVAEGWWRGTRQSVVAANIPEEELTFVWAEDGSPDALKVYETGGRVTLEEGGALVHGEAPPSLPNVDRLIQELGRLEQYKAGLVSAELPTADTQAQIDDLKAEILAIK